MGDGLKPKFDPTKSFGVVEKPKFDPSQSYEPITPGVGFAEDLGKSALGFAKGVGEVFNPAQIPHATEMLMRAPGIAAAKLYLGEGVHPLDALAEASKTAIIPEASVDKLAAGVRTAIDMMSNIRPTNSSSLADEIKTNFSNQLKSQELYNKTFINPTSEKLGEAAGTGVTLGAVALDISRATGLSNAIRNIAQIKAVDSLKPTKAASEALIKSDRMNEVGERLLNDGIITAGATWEKVKSRIVNKLNEYGEKVGYFAKTADDAVARDSSLRGLSVDELQQNIKKSVIDPLIEDGAISEAKAVQDWVDSLSLSSQGKTDVPFSQAQRWKRTLSKTKAKFDRNADTIQSEAFQDAHDVLNTMIEDGIDQAISKAAPQIKNEFIAAKEGYRDMMDAQKIITKTLAGKTSNRSFSLTDQLLAGAEGAGELASGAGFAEAGGKAGLIALANRIVRQRGNQAAAGFLGKISEINPEYLFKFSEDTNRKIRGLAEAIGASNITAPKEQSIEFTQPSLITPRKQTP